jgi:methylated-DNA-[protein]-cysteine S-methyltransferase
MYLDFIDTIVGTIKIYADENFLNGIEFVRCQNSKIISNKITNETKRQLSAYFQLKIIEFNLPLKIIGTEFQKKTWEQIARISFGNVRTYGQIAESIGNKYYSRAVGNAAGKNKFPIIIPCHRVVANSGLGGFSAGIEKKIILLKLEKYIK